MDNSHLHTLLQRQIDRYLGGSYPENLQPFIEAIHQAYVSFDDDRELMNRSFELSSQEMVQINNTLRKQGDERKKLIDYIQSLVDEFKHKQQKGMHAFPPEIESSDLVGILRFLIGQNRQYQAHLEMEKFRIEKAEAKDKTILQSIGDGLVVISTTGTIELVNNMFTSLTGWQAHEVVDQPILEILPPADREETMLFTVFDTTSYQEKLSNVTIEKKYTLRKKDGSFFPVSMSVSPILQQEKLIGLIQVFRDMTEYVLVEKTKGEFVSLASHQLRTPLSAIKWYVELVEQSVETHPLSEEQMRYLKEVEVATTNMSSLIRSFLNASRLELNSFMVEPKEANVLEIIEEDIAEVLPALTQKQLVLEKLYQITDTHCFVDPQIVHLIVENILTNAVKYTPEKGHITLTVTTDEEFFVFSIADTGIGIPQSEQTRIFTKLYRASNAKKLETDGNGLGLYMTKEVVTKIGGNLSFQSSLENGTVFTVKIPKVFQQKTGQTKLEFV